MHAFFKAASFAACTAAGLAACGSAPTADERRYAESCVATLQAIGQRGDAMQSRCACWAHIMVPKLSPGELNAMVNSSALNGQILTDRNTAQHGFTPADYGNLQRKTAESRAELTQTCGS